MQIIIPMAGNGQRFSEAGYQEIKPLITVAGKPMIQYVVDLFPGEDNFVFVCNSEHLKFTYLAGVLAMLKPQGTIAGVPFDKLGPVWSTLLAEQYIQDDEPVIVNYCDFDMQWDYEGFKHFAAETQADGIVISYTGFHPHLIGPNLYAGVRADSAGRIVEIKEKHCFSQHKMEGWHSNGTYYFKSGAIMKKYFRRLLQSHNAYKNGEYYVSMSYNYMLEDGMNVLLYPLKFFCQWGTPDDLQQYEAWREALSVSPDVDDFQLMRLSRQFPEIPLDAHRRALQYWKDFEQSKQLAVTFSTL